MLICDFAETYTIYDYRSLPLSLVVTFFVGLREDSRVKRLNKKVKVEHQTWLMMLIYDSLTILLYKLSGEKVKESELLTVAYLNEAEKENATEEKAKAFDSPDDFITEWNRRTAQKGD